MAMDTPRHVHCVVYGLFESAAELRKNGILRVCWVVDFLAILVL